MVFTSLDLEHEEALKDFLRDFERAGEENIPAYFADPSWPHAEIVRRFEEWSRGEKLEEEWVPSTTRFLLHEGRILGVCNLRHRLNDHLWRIGGHVGFAVRPSERRRGYGTRLLELAKRQARDMGIDRLLVTCGAGNVASRRVIQTCGGALSDEISDEKSGEDTFRFWIDL